MPKDSHISLLSPSFPTPTRPSTATNKRYHAYSFSITNHTPTMGTTRLPNLPQRWYTVDGNKKTAIIQLRQFILAINSLFLFSDLSPGPPWNNKHPSPTRTLLTAKRLLLGVVGLAEAGWRRSRGVVGMAPVRPKKSLWLRTNSSTSTGIHLGLASSGSRERFVGKILHAHIVRF